MGSHVALSKNLFCGPENIVLIWKFLILADGFGEKGSPATYQHAMVPPYANLTIDLELLTWKTVEILTDNEDVVKKILKVGQGYEKPNDGTIARGKIFKVFYT